ncbi:hypothetical protein JD844_010570 [Phrynosoma platyrhinos]|uniref:Uncharacterized protein n=1 Tax=Phrynosoma platyrhinos TaxID=52577 RepID=A0ABQ7THJ0_PHRPL|nr:hypothetical protein JD844_010570 [Phrynosoma platyrhinos]
MRNLKWVAGQPSFENEQRYRRLPAHRLPVYPIKRKLTVDGRRSPDPTLERQKLLKLRRSPCVPVTVSLEQKASPPTAQVSVGPIGVSCVSTSRAEPGTDSQVLHPSCPQKCPLRKSMLDSALTVSQLQQQISPLDQRSSMIPSGSPSPQRLHHPWTNSSMGPSTQLYGEASPKQRAEDKADKYLSPSP